MWLYLRDIYFIFGYTILIFLSLPKWRLAIIKHFYFSYWSLIFSSLPHCLFSFSFLFSSPPPPLSHFLLPFTPASLSFLSRSSSSETVAMWVYEWQQAPASPMLYTGFWAQHAFGPGRWGSWEMQASHLEMNIWVVWHTFSRLAAGRIDLASFTQKQRNQGQTLWAHVRSHS